MKVSAVVLLPAFVSLPGIASYATAAPVHGSAVAAHFDNDDADVEDDAGVGDDADEAPSRPGGKTHFSRNGDNAPSGNSDEAPSRPGGKTHFSRNGMTHDNTDNPVTGRDPDEHTDLLDDTLDTAGGLHHR